MRDLLTVPFLMRLFRFGRVTAGDLFLAVAGAVCAVLLMEIVNVSAVFGETKRRT